MARFSTGIYYLFAVLAALAVLANAMPAPAQNPAAMDSMGDGVAGMPGLGAVFKNKKQTPSQTMPDMDDDMDWENDIPSPSGSAMGIKAQPSARPTPGIPTPTSTPKASPTPSKSTSPLQNIPVLGPVLAGLPLFGR